MDAQIFKKVFSTITIVGTLATSTVNGQNFEDLAKLNNKNVLQVKQTFCSEMQNMRKEANNLIKEISPQLDKVIKVLDLAIPLSHKFVDFITEEQLLDLKKIINESDKMVLALNVLSDITELKSLNSIKQNSIYINEQLKSFYYFLKLNHVTRNRMDIGYTFETGATIADIRKVIG